MWVPKWQRDEKKGIDTPMPTQVVSNEEFIPPPQSKQQAQVEHLTMKWGEENAKKLNMSRRDFMRSSMGTATMVLASNAVWGPCWDVDSVEAFQPEATAEKFPKGEYFIIDVQSHFTNGRGIGFRGSSVLSGMGFDLANDDASYSFQNFVKEMYFDSDTSMGVISGVPTKENQRDDEGRVLQRAERGRGLLPSWLMSQRKADINEMAGSQRALCQGNCAPNHYWNQEKGEPDWPALYEQMEREVKIYGIDSWKWYCHTDPGRSGGGFQMDDENSAKFYEYSRKLGIKVFSVHKGFRAQSRTLGHLANPKDAEKAALENPDFDFVIYHSALMAGSTSDEIEFNPDTGEFLWHDDLINIMKKNPELTNLNAELGSAFNLSAVENPVLCQHLMGKNLKYFGPDHVVWGTDCLWWGSPQWSIDLMKRFTIPEELIEKHGYPQITKEDKAKIFGLNAARIYGVDVNEQRNALPADALTKFGDEIRLTDAGERTNDYYGWVRDDA
ncbi:amidohydrolase family protein [Candidatus Sumerlaeota bacterium]|nr:amidohydrolase family protein [Candidatus Sumerlaeota bacterium]